MTFKIGDKVVRKMDKQGFPWFKGSANLTVRRIEPASREIWFYELNGSWALHKFELALPQTFNDDEWE